MRTVWPSRPSPGQSFEPAPYAKGPQQRVSCHFRQTALDDIAPVDEHIAEIVARYRAADVSLRMPDALILCRWSAHRRVAVLIPDKRLARAAPGLAQLVVP
jgi:hypothetical protein